MHSVRTPGFLFASALAIVALPTLAFADSGSDVVTPQQVWMLASAALIFLMQGGFLALETGLVRTPAAPVTAMKSVVDWTVVSVLWVVFGFGMTFGHTVGGWFGSGYFMGEGVEATSRGWIFFLFQLGFAGTAVTIVSGAMAERVGFHTYVICSIVNGGLLYPLVAHWIWGGAANAQPTLLSGLGFLDFAGSTVVHSLGGWISLASIWILGPRIGRFGANGQPMPIEPHSMALASLGALVLWFGWWGFNGGSVTGTESAGLVIVNTNLAGAAGCLVGWMHGRWQTPDRDVEAKLLGGALAGLVAITASANIVSPASALIIGTLAAIVHNLFYEGLLRARLDDPVGAVPVHLGGGIFGTLCVAVFGKAELLPHGRLEQFGVQLIGVAAVGVLAVLVTTVLLQLLKRTMGLRLSPREERIGATLCRLPDEEKKPEALDEATLRRLMGGE